MTSKVPELVRSLLALLLLVRGLECPAADVARSHGIDTSSYTVWCKIYVTAEGTAKTVEVLRVEPHSESDVALGQAVKSAVLSWEFKPVQENGKPVAGYITIPVMWN